MNEETQEWNSKINKNLLHSFILHSWSLKSNSYFELEGQHKENKCINHIPHWQNAIGNQRESFWIRFCYTFHISLLYTFSHFLDFNYRKEGCYNHKKGNGYWKMEDAIFFLSDHILRHLVSWNCKLHANGITFLLWPILIIIWYFNFKWLVFWI